MQGCRIILFELHTSEVTTYTTRNRCVTQLRELYYATSIYRSTIGLLGALRNDFFVCRSHCLEQSLDAFISRQVSVQLPTSDGDVALPGFGGAAAAADRRPCSNRSISAVRRAHSSKPAAAAACGGRMMAWDRRTDGHPTATSANKVSWECPQASCKSVPHPRQHLYHIVFNCV